MATCRDRLLIAIKRNVPQESVGVIHFAVIDCAACVWLCMLCCHQVLLTVPQCPYLLDSFPHVSMSVMPLGMTALPAQDRGERRGSIVAPAVWLAEFLSEVNEHFAVKQLARSEFYSTALSESIEVVWEYHAWRQALVSRLTAMVCHPRVIAIPAKLQIICQIITGA